MNRVDFEKYKKEKLEYDKEIRRLDYKIVEESVQLYNLSNRSKAVETKSMAKENDEKIYKLIDSIDKSEKTKKILTKQIFSKFEIIKKDLLKEIENLQQRCNNLKDQLIVSKIALNKIHDVYFDVLQIEPVINYIEIENQNINQIIELNNENENIEKINEDPENVIQKSTQQDIFDIPKQRVIDFENLLKYMHTISQNYRNEIEEKINDYINKYDILTDSTFMQNKFNNVRENFIVKFNNVIIKFKKDENLDEINNKVQNLLENNKNIEIEKQNLLNDTQVMKEKIEKLQDVYLVHSYARKILDEFILHQVNEEKNIRQSKMNEDITIFKKIQKITYDERIRHIIEVSKWTKVMESKLKYQRLKENDFQTIIYAIRQTENTCNINYENITNQILKLCEAYTKLEEIENVNNLNKQILDKNIETSDILKEGINVIKKKYLKIPFIGRKVANILNSNALNA